jgi:hypothetical protein
MAKIVYIAEEAGQSFVAAGITWQPGRYVVDDEDKLDELEKWVPSDYLEVRDEDDEPDEPVAEEEPESSPTGPLTVQQIKNPETQPGKASKKPCPVCGKDYRNLSVHQRSRKHYPKKTKQAPEPQDDASAPGTQDVPALGEPDDVPSVEQISAAVEAKQSEELTEPADNELKEPDGTD